MPFSCCLPSRSITFSPHEHEVVRRADSSVLIQQAQLEQSASEPSPSPLLNLDDLPKNEVVQQLIGTGGKHAAAALHKVCREMRTVTLANLPSITVRSTEELKRAVEKCPNVQEVVFRIFPGKHYSFAPLNGKRLPKLTIESDYERSLPLPSIDTAEFANLGLVQSLILKEDVIDTGKAALPDQPTLQHLQLEKCGNLSKPLLALLKRTPLRSLRLTYTTLDDADLLQIAALPKLDQLAIEACGGFSSNGLAACLDWLPSLKSLHLKELSVDGEAFAPIGGLGKLERLTLESCFLDPGPVIAPLKNLIELNLSPVNGSIETAISCLPLSLQTLRLEEGAYNVDPRPLSDAALEQLGRRLSCLKTLSLEHAGVISDAGIASICGLERLEDLDLDFCYRKEPVTRASLAHLNDKPLKRLKIVHCDLAADAFKDVDWPQLSELELRFVEGLSESTFSDLAQRIPSLAYLNFSTRQSALPELHHLAQLKKLEGLNLKNFGPLSKAALEPLADLPIKKLWCYRCQDLTALPPTWWDTLEYLNDKPWQPLWMRLQ